MKINPEFIWEVKDQWNEYIQREEIELAGQTPYLIVERSPANQLIFNKMVLVRICTGIINMHIKLNYTSTHLYIYTNRIVLALSVVSHWLHEPLSNN